MESNFTLAAYVFLFPAVLLSLISLIKEKTVVHRLSIIALGLSFSSLTLALTLRGISAGRMPFATLYEFTLLFAWGIMLVFFLSRVKLNSSLLTSLVSLLSVVIISFSGTVPAGVKPLMPALQSVWLQFHVAAAILAYGAFGVSFCLAGAYFIKEKAENGLGKTLPSPEKIDSLIHWSVSIGFPFMTLAIITGAVWAEEVWGSWWSWDPKETWALITWIIYAGYLHSRKTRGWRGRKAALMAVAGFLAVLFTLFGVTFLLPGAHSYA